MKILARKEHSIPIAVAPGDILVLSLDEPGKPSREVLRHTFDGSTSFDTYMVAELEADETSELGLESGHAGIFGKRSEAPKRGWFRRKA